MRVNDGQEQIVIAPMRSWNPCRRSCNDRATSKGEDQVQLPAWHRTQAAAIDNSGVQGQQAQQHRRMIWPRAAIFFLIGKLQGHRLALVPK